MVSSHGIVAIIEMVLYAPIIPTAIYVLCRNWTHGRPRMAWYPLIGFSIIRLAGGVVVIVMDTRPRDILKLLNPSSEDLGLIIAALVLLNIGVIPLIISTMGLIRTIIADSFELKNPLKRIIKGLRVAILIAISLLSSGGGLNGTTSMRNTGRALTQAGYVIFAVMIAIMAAILVRLGSTAAPRASTYLLGSRIALPFLTLRTIYGLISAFNPDFLSFWNPVYGSPVAFALMALLPEYITVLIYLYLGFQRIGHAKRLRDSEALEAK